MKNSMFGMLKQVFCPWSLRIKFICKEFKNKNAVGPYLFFFLSFQLHRQLIVMLNLKGACISNHLETNLNIDMIQFNEN